MALSATEKTQLKALITREGGLDMFADEVRDMYIADRQAAALAALQSAISVTVTDWAALTSYVQQASNITLYSVMNAIKAKAAAQDALDLGPLLVALFAAVDKHMNPA